VVANTYAVVVHTGADTCHDFMRLAVPGLSFSTRKGAWKIYVRQLHLVMTDPCWPSGAHKLLMRVAVKARFWIRRGISTCQSKFYNVQKTFLRYLQYARPPLPQSGCKSCSRHSCDENSVSPGRAAPAGAGFRGAVTHRQDQGIQLPVQYGYDHTTTSIGDEPAVI
jgi:hypothetical protein